MKYSDVNRREMMGNCLRGIAGLSLASLAGSCESGGSWLSGGKPRKRGFKIGACDWSLGKSSDPGSFEVARAIGLDGVQVNMGGVKNNVHLRKGEVQKAFLTEAKKNGMEIASFCLLDLNRLPYKSDAHAEQWVSDSIDVCKAMRVEVVMLPFFGRGDLKNDEKGVDVVVERLKRVA
ncbi:MAG: sugar phosphate isomerase/epimerase family protein, partial [Planctomycetota bacterium]